MVPLSRVKAIRIRTRRVLLGRIEPWERIYRAITFFGQIFQPFHNYSSLRPRLENQGDWLAGFSIIQSTTNRMKPGEKEVNTLERSFVFLFLQIPNPLSLAATNGVSVDFPSFSYLDVSVR